MSNKIYIPFFIVFITLLFVRCNNDDNHSSAVKYESTASIVGRDLTLCACCGNWFIQIDDTDNINLFEALPEGSDIDLENIDFPVDVKLNWSLPEGEPCGFDIIIDQIQLAD